MHVNKNNRVQEGTRPIPRMAEETLHDDGGDASADAGPAKRDCDYNTQPSFEPVREHHASHVEEHRAGDLPDTRFVSEPHNKLARSSGLTPRPKPWQRRNCQYCVHSAVSSMHATNRIDAANMGSLKYPQSNSLPKISPGA